MSEKISRAGRALHVRAKKSDAARFRAGGVGYHISADR
jgi:hypothetical protein